MFGEVAEKIQALSDSVNAVLSPASATVKRDCTTVVHTHTFHKDWLLPHVLETVVDHVVTCTHATLQRHTSSPSLASGRAAHQCFVFKANMCIHFFVSRSRGVCNVCVVMVMCACSVVMCDVGAGVGVQCVVCGVWCVVCSVCCLCVARLGTRKNPPCVDSKRPRVYVQNVAVYACTTRAHAFQHVDVVPVHTGRTF